MISLTKPVTPSSRSTGIDILDKKLDGGLPEGSLVCIYANPISMPEAFLYQFATVVKTFYFITSRPAKFVKENIENMGLSADKIEFIDVFTQYYMNEYGQFVIVDRYRDKDIFDFIDHHLNRIQENKGKFNVIFDSISFFLKLDVPLGLKEWLINKLYIQSKQTNNVYYIYLMKNVHPIDIVNMVLDVSDVVFDIDTERVGDRMSSRLAIPKIRDKTPMLETFKFYISEGVQIDTSRDIA
ncbi:MAG: recombinase RecA [Archaeoglobus sp.]|nr:MAG: recombinase RecA [Archaeoglobus sp.]